MGLCLGIPLGSYVARVCRAIEQANGGVFSCGWPDLLHLDGGRRVTLATGLLFGAIWWRLGPGSGHPWPQLVLASVYSLFLVAMFAIDWQTRYILNQVSYPAIAFAAAAGWLWRWPEDPDPLRAVGLSWLGGALAFLLFFAFYKLAQLIYGPGAFGFGDVTLATFIGLATGLPSGYPPCGPNVLSALFVGSGVGAAAAALAWLSRRKSLREHISYGPALISGTLIVMLW